MKPRCFWVQVYQMFPSFWRWSDHNNISSFTYKCFLCSGLKRSVHFPLQCHRLHYDRWVLLWFFWRNSSQLLENQLTHMWGLTVIRSDVFCPLLRRDVPLSLVTTKKKWQITGFCQSTYQSVGFLEIKPWGQRLRNAQTHHWMALFPFFALLNPLGWINRVCFMQAESTWKGRSFKRAEGFSKLRPSAGSINPGEKDHTGVGGKTRDASDGTL